MSVLAVQGISKNFGGVKALKDISFTVFSGEKVALIGPNGAGKTTLFNIITGQLPASSGQIYFQGEDISNVDINLRTHLGMARSFQINSLFFNRSVQENTLLAVLGTRPSRFNLLGNVHKDQEINSHNMEILKMFDLWEMKDELVQNISYGHQRKLEIALTLVSKPTLVLLDEPTAGLTAGESITVMQKINEIKKETTLLFVCHDMDLVLNLADRVIVLHYGEIVAAGSCEDIRNNTKVKDIYFGKGEYMCDFEIG